MNWFVFLEGVAILVGTVLGSGYLTLPYSFLQAGIGANLFWFVFFIIFITILHLLYAEVVLATKSNHRLPGYVGLYLGKRSEILAIISFVFGVFGGLLVYFLLGVHFLSRLTELFMPTSQEVLALVFWLGVSALLFVNFKLSSKANLSITLITVALFVVISFVALSKAKAEHLGIVPEQSIFFPYGLILYAMVGSLAIPETINLLRLERQKEELIKPVIIVGTLVPAVVYFLFSLGIFSAAGLNTSPDALSGLNRILPQSLTYIAFAIAFLNIASSYFIFEVSVFQTLQNDFRLNKLVSFLLVAFLPPVLFFIGIKDYVMLMRILGAVFVSIDSVLIVLLYLNLPDKLQGYQYRLIQLPRFVSVMLIAIFVCGGVLGLINIL